MCRSYKLDNGQGLILVVTRDADPESAGLKTLRAPLHLEIAGSVK